MAEPILFYWPPCSRCKVVTDFADENHIELDKRDVEQQEPYDQLLELGGDSNKIPYLFDEDRLIQGEDNVVHYLKEKYLM